MRVIWYVVAVMMTEEALSRTESNYNKDDKTKDLVNRGQWDSFWLEGNSISSLASCVFPDLQLELPMESVLFIQYASRI